jgi:ABC-type nickel/cobalt efflux system permease component RcnA
VARGVLLALGAAGGLVPSPSALLLLLGAVAAGRAFLGVGLVLMFGLGMAATLAAVGGVAVGLRDRLDGLGGRAGRWWRPVRRLMPVSSGAVICLIGIGMAARGVGAAIA